MKSLAKSALAVAVVLLAAASPAAAGRLDDVKARGKLIVGVSDTTPPFSFKLRRVVRIEVAGTDGAQIQDPG
jgi:polar amino acid transport system substrate-binding protein